MWRTLVGDPLETQRLSQERLTKTKGLAVFSSDALSSSTYATEEILHVVVIAGIAGLSVMMPVAASIVILLMIVTLSYYQTIRAYPAGGGAYIVSRDNLGVMPGLIAAAALLVDYVLTVAVSISAGVAAITSAVPELFPHRVDLAVAFVVLISIANLRGVRESGAVFAIPSYAFITIFGGMVLWGLLRIATGQLPHAEPQVHAPVHGSEFQAATLFLIFRAFASGAAALTGVEAVSNGTPAFRPPESRNATTVLLIMVGILGVMFLGTSFLARWLGVVPLETETVVSQISRTLIGGESWMYFGVQAATALILIVAANTAYAAFPFLTSMIARDRYLPRQLSNLGDRLVFSNGILVLGLAGAILLIGFNARTHSLIPLYMIGVFLSFTLSQAGMVRHGLRERARGWQVQVAISGFGAACTAVVGAVVAVVKFADGAWITVFAIAGIVLVMRAIKRHYADVARQLSLENMKTPEPFRYHKVVVPINDVHRGILEAVRYAKSVTGDVTAVYVEIDQARREDIEQKWEQWVPDVPLVVLPSPYRSIVRPILLYLDHIHRESGPRGVITVVLPEFVPRKWWHHLLHNQSALMLKFALLFRARRSGRYKVLADVPYYLSR